MASALRDGEVDGQLAWQASGHRTPRGPGHYDQDSDQDVLEVEAEDLGGTSLVASLVTTLSSQYGNGWFRFVARARSADRRWPTSTRRPELDWEPPADTGQPTQRSA